MRGSCISGARRAVSAAPMAKRKARPSSAATCVVGYVIDKGLKGDLPRTNAVQKSVVSLVMSQASCTSARARVHSVLESTCKHVKHVHATVGT